MNSIKYIFYVSILSISCNTFGMLGLSKQGINKKAAKYTCWALSLPAAEQEEIFSLINQENFSKLSEIKQSQQTAQENTPPTLKQFPQILKAKSYIQTNSILLTSKTNTNNSKLSNSAFKAFKVTTKKDAPGQHILIDVTNK